MEVKSNWIKGLLLSAVFLCLSFPLFYFVYKFGNPEPIAHDFFQYYRLYLNWEVDNVISPLNMRLVGALFVHLFYRMNLYYDTNTCFDSYKGWGFLEQIYFDALLFNWICVALTCVAIYNILRDRGVPSLLSFNGGVLFLLGFGTLFYLMMPLTDACSVLIFAWAYRVYLRKSWWMLAPMALLIFQREYVLLAILLIAVADWVRYRSRYHAVIAGTAVAFTVVHIGLRMTIFHNTPLSFQVSPSFLWHSLLNPDFQPWLFIRQQALTLSLFWLYLGVVCYKMFLRITADRFEMLKILLLLLQVNLVSFAGALGTNVGRYYYLLAPVLVVQLVTESAVLFQSAAAERGTQ